MSNSTDVVFFFTGKCTDDGGDSCDWNQYCVQSCEKWNSPFFCDRDHPQDIFAESEGRSTWNHLVNAVLVDGGARTAYFRELKNAMESLHDSGWLEGEANRLRGVIASDAARDARGGGSGIWTRASTRWFSRSATGKKFWSRTTRDGGGTCDERNMTSCDSNCD
jgi:hypothetical protein